MLYLHKQGSPQEIMDMWETLRKRCIPQKCEPVCNGQNAQKAELRFAVPQKINSRGGKWRQASVSFSREMEWMWANAPL